MNSSIWLFAILIFFCTPLFAKKQVIEAAGCMMCHQNTQDSQKETQHTIHAMKKHIEFLTDPSLDGRLTGSRGERHATKYIADYLAALNFKNLNGQQDFFQSFTFKTPNNKKKA